jgi:peptidoglycan/LPS O-acetylase OafA/YrhL
MGGRIAAIEGLRGLAALSVLVFHVWFYCGDIPQGSTGTDWLFSRLWVGVPVFFAISGFVLYRPYAAASFRGKPWPSGRRYAVNRIARIVPAYWVVLTVVIAVSATSLFSSGWPSFLFLQTVDPDARTVLGVAWTLVCEAMFYVALPALAWVLARTRGPRHAALLVGALVPLGLAARWVMLRDGFAPSDVTLLTTIDAFAVGMLAALLETLRWGSSRVRWAGLAMFPVAFLFLPPFGMNLPRQQLLATAATTAVAGSIALLLIGARQIKALDARPLVVLGSVSYGVYLWHEPLIAAGNNTVGLRELPFAAAIGMVASTVVIVATASWFLIEKPAINLGRRIGRHSRGEGIVRAPADS